MRHRAAHFESRPRRDAGAPMTIGVVGQRAAVSVRMTEDWACAPWCWSDRARRSCMRERPVPAAGVRRNPDRGRGLRGLPHRSARRRRRAAESEAPDRARPRDRRPRRGDRERESQDLRSASASASPGSAPPAGSAPIAAAVGRICAIGRCLPATRAMAATRRHALADARYCFPLPERRDDAEVAPFLCAGPDRLAQLSHGGRGVRRRGRPALGLYGFGAAAHILAQVAAWQGRRVYAFTRSRR